MEQAILVDTKYFRKLEHLHETMVQVSRTDSELLARRNLVLALGISQEICEEFLEA